MAEAKSKAERRERVAELIGKRDRRITEIVVDEGYFGSPPRLKAERDLFMATARRAVCRDRAALREEWRKEALTPPPDNRAARLERAARLQSLSYDCEAILDDPKARATARVQALAEQRLLEVEIAKLLGLYEQTEKSDDPSNDLPFLGLVLSVRNVSQKALDQAEQWNSEKKARGKDESTTPTDDEGTN